MLSHVGSIVRNRASLSLFSTGDTPVPPCRKFRCPSFRMLELLRGQPMTINPYQPPQSGPSSAHPAPLPVRVTGVLTAEDAQRALRAAMGGRRAFWFIISGAAVVVLGTIGLMIWQGDWIRLWAAAFQVVAVVIIGCVLFVLSKRRFAASWNGRPENRQPVSWTFSNEGLLIETTSGKQLHYWNSFAYATIPADKVILAQRGGLMFNFVPRRLFETDEDWAAVCQLLALKLPVRETSRR